MNRRALISTAISLVATACARQYSADQQSGELDLAVPDFPFELVAVPGWKALAEFDRLRSANRGSPVILGGSDHLAGINDGLRASTSPDRPDTTQILAMAGRLVHPQSLERRLADESTQLIERLAQLPDEKLPQFRDPTDGRLLAQAEVRERLEAGTLLKMLDPVPPLGEWPEDANRYNYELLSMLQNYQTGQLPERVFIAVIPTADWTEIPAYLRFGGWNACPGPEYHIAAFRSWRDRYGAELVSITGDTAEMRISARPQSREEAIALARELSIYDSDVTDTLAPLAASLMTANAWGFWWD